MKNLKKTKIECAASVVTTSVLKDLVHRFDSYEEMDNYLLETGCGNCFDGDEIEEVRKAVQKKLKELALGMW